MASGGRGQGTIGAVGSATDPAGSGALAFDALYRTYARRVRGLARRRLSDPQQVDDAVQETFLHAYRALHTLDPNRPVWPWLSRIADNVCVDMLRLLRTHPDLVHAELTDAMVQVADRRADPADWYAAGERRRHIAAALAAVCQRQRRVLMLREVEGWSYEDIAAVEDMTIDALKGTLKRARQSFRAAYAAIVETGGGLAAALSPRRAWRWLRARARTAVDRLEEAAGSFTGWSGLPVGQMGGFVAAATVTLAAVVGAGGGARGIWSTPDAPSRTGAAVPIVSATTASRAGPAGGGTGPIHTDVDVGVATPPVGALTPVGASAMATRSNDVYYSRGLAHIGAELPVNGHFGQGVGFQVQCSEGVAQAAACAALSAVPDPE
jgi:RNA polymerase sigma-70 factor (ECF subfamily)